MKQMKMIRTLILTIGTMMMLAILTSCAEDDPVKDESKEHTLTITFSTTVEAVPETKAIVRKASAGSEAAAAGFSYELVSSDADSCIESRPITKAPTTLKNVYALLFKSNGTFNGRANIGTMTTGTDKVITFTDVAEAEAASCRLVVVANDNAAGNNYTSPSGTGGFANFSGNYAAFQELTMTNNVSTDADIPYAGTATVDLFAGGASATTSVQLYRTLAKITLTNTFSITDGPARNSITLYNTGTKYFATRGNDNYNGTGSTQTTSFVTTTTGSNANSNTWYVGENIRPAGSNITSAADRNSSKAPANASYVRIQSAQSNANVSVGNFVWIGASFTYDIYLGKSGTLTDFSLRRHANYTITSTVSGSPEAQINLASNDERVMMECKGAGITINQTLADTYKSWIGGSTDYPPFNYDGGSVFGTTGSDKNGDSFMFIVTKEYSVEVEKTEHGTTVVNYQAAIDYCKGLGTGWRVPTMIELKGMYENRTELQNAGCAAFLDRWYWSSSVYNENAGGRCILFFNNGSHGYAGTGDNGNYIRCVRDI